MTTSMREQADDLLLFVLTGRLTIEQAIAIMQRLQHQPPVPPRVEHSTWQANDIVWVSPPTEGGVS